MKSGSQKRIVGLAVGTLLGLASISVHASTMTAVKERGAIRCGVSEDLPGFARANSLGEYKGFTVDLCRAVASAVFNDSEAVEMIPVSSTERFNALVDGRIDILSRVTTWTLERNALYGDFAGVNFYDGQGFMVPKRSGVQSALELDNKPICVTRNTTTELNAADYFSVSKMSYKPVFYDDEKEAADGYIAGDCQAFTTDRSGLAAQRSEFDEPDAHVILPEVISKEPLGPLLPPNDSEWTNVVRWSMNCMINAEELGVTSLNVDDESTASTPAIRRLIGVEGETGNHIGVDLQWCTRVIRQVGNYGEVYSRHIGPDTPIGLPRGLNALWTNGGLIYAPPIR